MTETNTAPTTTTTLAADDPRAFFARAVRVGGAVIGAVRPDQLPGRTPCDDYDVRLLCGHLVSVLRRVAAVGRGESPFSVPQETTGVADDGWLDAWTAAAHEVQAVWSDDAVLDTMLTLPWTSLPGRIALSIYVAEVSTHTWDLAAATGQTPAWDDEVASYGLAAMQQAAPAEMPRGGEVPFAAIVEVPADAPAIERLVAWSGRDPRWS